MDTVDKLSRQLLIMASLGHFAVALLHYVMPFLGSWAYGYFGAPELTTMAEAGSSLPAIATIALAMIFTIFGFMGLSAAGVFRSLGIIRPILWVLGIVYVLRGFLAVPQIHGIVQGSPLPLRHAVFSLVAFTIGALQIWGLWRSRKSGSSTPSHAA
jgi:hypothetical protein